MLMGLAEFTLGSSDKAVEHIERAFELGSEEIVYAGILAAAYGELGRIDQATEAFDMFQRAYANQPELARSMVWFPFSDPYVLERLAEGLELAGAKVYYTREDGGYLPLHELNRLSGAEIQQLLSGKKIEGKFFWYTPRWQRFGAADGDVEYAGFPIQPSAPQNAIGTSRVEDDMLCERWPELPEPLELCSVIFRVPEGNARIRWGKYVLATDRGPQPFNLAP
jgi:tetratricopeptide (TPR) repeat protein